MPRGPDILLRPLPVLFDSVALLIKVFLYLSSTDLGMIIGATSTPIIKIAASNILFLLKIINAIYIPATAIHELLDSVNKKGTATRPSAINDTAFTFWYLYENKIPDSKEIIKTRYPPNVLGSPSLPSKGGEILSPEGICAIAYNETTPQL